MYYLIVIFFFFVQARQTKDPLNPLDMEQGFNMVSINIRCIAQLAGFALAFCSNWVSS